MSVDGSMESWQQPWRVLTDVPVRGCTKDSPGLAESEYLVQDEAIMSLVGSAGGRLLALVVPGLAIHDVYECLSVSSFFCLSVRLSVSSFVSLSHRWRGRRSNGILPS